MPDDNETFLVSSGRRKATCLLAFTLLAGCSAPSPVSLNLHARQTITARASDLAEFEDYFDSFDAQLMAVWHPTPMSEERRYYVDGKRLLFHVDADGCKILSSERYR